ncbi:MAG TPA: hypothetical protein VHO25_22610 [Polyangiaceae bacterium]|nr:hypothetical protein [Polyangiaceae bacterium]
MRAFKSALISLPVLVSGALWGCSDRSAQSTGTTTSVGTDAGPMGVAGQGGNTSPGDPQPDAGSVSGDESADCEEFGIEIVEGCSQCPATPLDCDCLNGFGLFPEERCTFGGCITAIDCERVCLNFEGMVGPDFGSDVLAIQDCVATLQHCPSGEDGECGSDGRCVLDTFTDSSWCSLGDLGAACIEPTDCRTELFCVGYGICASGEPGAECNTTEHCLAGSCLIYTPSSADPAGQQGDPQQELPQPELPQQGVCTSGLPNERCTEDVQCQGSLHCVPGFPSEVLGNCSPGEVDDLCNDDGDCQSGFCFSWEDPSQESGRCTTGGFRSYCLEVADCESGYCSRQPNNAGSPGTCVPGDAGSPCWDDQACASAHCALNNPSNEGLCTSGATGDPCQDNAECESNTCLAPSLASSLDCAEGPGASCEGDGICAGNDGVCFQGKCE